MYLSACNCYSILTYYVHVCFLKSGCVWLSAVLVVCRDWLISFLFYYFHLQVILSHNKPSLTFSLPSEIKQAPPLVKVLDDGSLIFQDGSVAHAQVLLLCTGYNYHYPFLCLKQLGLEVQHHLVGPLYKNLVLPAFPSLFFIGVCKIICPFLHFHYQVSI